MDVIYSLLKAEDTEQAIEFSLKSRQLLFPELYAASIPKDIAQFADYYVQHPLGCFMVAKVGQQIIGSIAYRAYDHRFQFDLPTDTVEVVKLFVLPEYRRQGIATALCQQLFAYAQQKGIQTLYLHTHPFLPAAELFWQLQGFKLLRREQLKMYDTIHMLRTLPEV